MDVFDPLPRTKSGNGCLTLYLELRVAMDEFDPLPRTKGGNVYVWPFN